MMHLTRLSMLLAFLLCAGAIQAQFTVVGNVSDPAGDPLIGVSILIEGSTRGTVTDLDGNFSLEVPGEQATLQFSYTGFQAKELVVTSADQNIQVTLEEDVANLEEVVVTGLASSVKRSNLANAVSTVSGEQLSSVTSQTSVDGALYGKLTGVNIIQNSGAPGGGISIRLRGISSLSGNNQPLIIIDGVYMSNVELRNGSRFASGANDQGTYGGAEENTSNRLADLNPEDIENIEVLKGASAAAIYGTRANAGVIIITTKKGAAGKTKVSLEQDLGFNRIINFVGRRQYTAQQVEEAFGADERAKFEEAQANGRIFDYEKELYGETGLISDTRFSVSGGNQKTTFFIGSGYRTEDGIVKNTGYDRLTARLNITHEISDRFSITSTTNYINSKALRSFTGNENEGGLSFGYNLAFTRDWNDLFPDEDGTYPNNPTAAGNMIFVRDQARNQENVNRVIQGLNFDWNIFQTDRQVLRLNVRGGIDFTLFETEVYVPETHQGTVGKDNGWFISGKNTLLNYNYQVIGSHNFFAGNVSFNTQAGITYLNFDRDLVQSRTSQLVPLQQNLGQGGAQVVTQRFEKEEEFGFFAQETVNWDDKIIATVGLRADKSSLNGDPNQYYFFPRASLAVNIANFNFWDIGVWNDFKLRAAYGQTGNSASFGSLYTALVPQNVNVSGTAGFVVSTEQGDSELEPETSQEIEFGTDLSFFQNRLGVEFTYYIRSVSDLLYQRAIPSSSGFSSEIRNDLDLENRGVELAITANVVRARNVQWNTNVNFWFNRSEITRLGVENTTENPADNPDDIPSFTPPDVAFGLSLGTFFINEGSPITGLWTNEGPEGTPVQVGDVEPDFQLGWFNEFTIIQNLRFNFLLHWKQGGDVLNLTRLLTDIGGTTPRDIAEEFAEATNFIEDATYLRLREIGLYYSFPINSSFLNQIRIGASARNLLTFTNYSSYDPEVSTKGGAGLSNSIEVTPFPSSRQAYFHLGFDF